MPISFQSIRDFQATNMVWDDQKGVMKSAGFWQKFKTFFNIGHAREQNAATLAAIKNAVFSSFPADDLKALAEERINQVRTDRVVGAAQIKGILDEIARIGGKTQAAIKERTLMHLAVAPDLPPKLRHAKEEITAFVVDQISRDPNVQRNPGSADIKGMSADLLRRIGALGDTLQGTQDSLDGQLLHTVFKNLGRIAWKDDANGNSVERPNANRRMEFIQRYWTAVQTRAQQTGNPDEFGKLALEALDDLIQHHPDPYDRLESLIEMVPLEDLQNRDFDLVRALLASLPRPAPDPACLASPGQNPTVAIRDQEELVDFLRTLHPTSQFGAVSEDDEAEDVAGVQRRTFIYRGIVFRGDKRKPDDIKADHGFQSQNALHVDDFEDEVKAALTPEQLAAKAKAHLTEAMGLGVRTVNDDGSVTYGTWGATGHSGVSTAKSADGAINYAGDREWFYVIDTAKLPAAEHPWEMEHTVYENKYKIKDGKEVTGSEVTGSEVNCSRIPFNAIVGWVRVSGYVDAVANQAERVRRLQGEADNFQFNPEYQP